MVPGMPRAKRMQRRRARVASSRARSGRVRSSDERSSVAMSASVREMVLDARRSARARALRSGSARSARPRRGPPSDREADDRAREAGDPGVGHADADLEHGASTPRARARESRRRFGARRPWDVSSRPPGGRSEQPSTVAPKPCHAGRDHDLGRRAGWLAKGIGASSFSVATSRMTTQKRDAASVSSPCVDRSS